MVSAGLGLSYTGESVCIYSAMIGVGWVCEMVFFLLGCAFGREQHMNGRNRPYYTATSDGMGLMFGAETNTTGSGRHYCSRERRRQRMYSSCC
jgi:hypothetical protein